MISIKRKTIAGILLTAFVLFLFQSYVSAQTAEDQDNETRSNPPQAQFTAEGVAGCLRCHAGDHSSVMAETAHGNEDNPHTPYATNGCESCHGPGSFHSSRARGGVGFPALMTFRGGEEPGQEQNQACLDCHGKDLGELQGIEWEGSRHQDIHLTCGMCHESHLASNPMKDLETQRAKCGLCHRGQVEDHFDNLPCSTCHDVHAL